MIDCKLTNNYFKEKQRMCDTIKCKDCLLRKLNDNDVFCEQFEKYNINGAIGIVQKWSNRNPLKTNLTEFLKHYPDVELNTYGYPTKISPCSLCIVNDIICGKPYSAKATRCQDCLYTPIEHVE